MSNPSSREDCVFSPFDNGVDEGAGSSQDASAFVELLFLTVLMPSFDRDVTPILALLPSKLPFPDPIKEQVFIKSQPLF